MPIPGGVRVPHNANMHRHHPCNSTSGIPVVVGKSENRTAGTYAEQVRTIERVLRIVVASALTVIFAAWSVHLFESQPSGVSTVQIPKCAAGDQPCFEHALKVAFSNVDGHWSLWVVWVFWAVIAVIWLAACILILWAPRRISNSSSVKLVGSSVDDPFAGSVERTTPAMPRVPPVDRQT